MDDITEQGQDWLTILKVALQIYNGDMKGFALLPAAIKQRKIFMQDYMKSLLKSSIETVVNKYHRNQTVNDNQESCAFSMKEIAIKVSIEFCLAISDVGFLFN